MRFTIPAKLLSLIALSTIVIIIAVSVQLFGLRDRLWSDREDLIRSQVETTISVFAGYQARVDAGEMSLEEAQTAAGDVMRTIRYGNNDYMFVYTPDGTRVKFPEHKGKARISGISRIATAISWCGI